MQDSTVSGDGYELADYGPIEERRDREKLEQHRQRKLFEKRRWLEEQDDMKFSHSIQFNAVPDWSSHYIAYSNLKKLWVTPADYAVSLPTPRLDKG